MHWEGGGRRLFLTGFKCMGGGGGGRRLFLTGFKCMGGGGEKAVSDWVHMHGKGGGGCL